MAVDVLISRGVPEEHILFLNLIASPEGVTSFARRYPKLRVVTAFVDQGLDEKKCVLCDDSPCWPQLTGPHGAAISFRDWVILETVIILYKSRPISVQRMKENLVQSPAKGLSFQML